MDSSWGLHTTQHTLLVVLALSVLPNCGAYRRSRVADEIIPDSASASYTPNSYYGPSYAIDLQWSTYSYTSRGYGSTTWLKINLGDLYCVEQVLEYANTGYPWTVWTCSSNSNCYCSGGGYYSTSSCYSTAMSVYTEGSARTNLPALSCRYGDTVKLSKSSGHDMTFYELIVTGSRARCTAGNYMTSSGCRQCGANTYSGAGASSCTSCPSGKISRAGSTTQSDCYYAPCSAGDYLTESGCRQCDENTYSGAGAFSCTECPDNKVSAAGSTALSDCYFVACESEKEHNPKYGLYLWPVTLLGEQAELPCLYNPDSRAYKQCDEETNKFGQADFGRCKSKVHEKIESIQEDSQSINNDTELIAVATEIMEVTKSESDLMNSEDVKKTTEIIENLLQYNVTKAPRELNEKVRENILKTVDGVHKSTDAEELAKSDAAIRIRNSVEKLSDTISKDSKSVYLKEETVGLVVTKTSGNDASFSVFGEKDDYTRTELVDSAAEPLLFSVNVPADSKDSPVTAVLYDSPKFFPDKETVKDLTSALAGRLTSSNRTETSTVVSMVTEIKYANSTGRIEFDAGKNVEMIYNVKEEVPRVYYKMYVESRYDCAYYNTTTLTWDKGIHSGCTTKVDFGDKGEKLVSCQCNHMTSFAVLMSFDSDYDPMEETVTSILLGISFGCLVFTIIAYLPAKEMLRSRPVRLNLLLTSSLIFSIISFYFMELAVMNEVKANKVPAESDTASAPCVIVAFLMNYFWLCQMAWMVCEALVMYRALVSAVMNSHIHKYMLKFNLACWGIPLIFPLIGVGWGRADYANPKTCFLRRKYGLVTFYGPVVLSTVLNIYLFIRIAWSTFTKKSLDTGSMSLSAAGRLKKQFKFAITVMTLLGVGWVFGFFLIFLETNIIWIRWLFIVSNSTQGIFIFVLYVVLNDGLRKVWRRLLRRSSQKPKISHSSALPQPGTAYTDTHKHSVSSDHYNSLEVNPGHHRLSVDVVLSPLPHHHGSHSTTTNMPPHSPNVQRKPRSPNVQRRPRSPNVNRKPRPHSTEESHGSVDMSHIGQIKQAEDLFKL